MFRRCLWTRKAVRDRALSATGKRACPDPRRRLRMPCLFVWVFVAGPALAGDLVINANTSDPAPRAAWEKAVVWFRHENPDVDVRFNIYDHESYKRALRNWLTSASPDIVFWFAGQRMREFVAPGLLADVSDLFTPDIRAALHPSAIDLVSAGGRQFGVPYARYQVGFYFRRDLVEAGGRSFPRSWDDLVRLCERLKAAGIEPFAIGTRELWPAAAWFDYINLRVNGYAFHMALMAGEAPYTEERVRRVFVLWRELLDRQCFMRTHASMSWQEAQAFLYHGRAAAMLIGNYIVAQFPRDSVDRMDFAPFPVIDPGIGAAEDAPMNTIHIPERARNKADARRFLAFVLRADVQEELNKTLLLLPVNHKSGIAEDRFLRRGAELLARAEALAQFFDRDTSEDLASVAMKGFQEFMLRPERLDAILATIERARQRIYGRR